jgi:hypothetical protein
MLSGALVKENPVDSNEQSMPISLQQNDITGIFRITSIVLSCRDFTGKSGCIME